MVIRNEQADAFQQRARTDFENRALAHFRQDLTEPAAPFPDSELRAMLWQAATEAEPWGLTTEREIISYADATLLLGQDFDKNPQYEWAPQILRRRGWSPEERARHLIETAWMVYQRRRPGAK